MGNWTRTKAAGLLFVAAAAVYSDGLVRAMAGEKATPATPADNGNKSVANSAAPVAKPVTVAKATTAPTTTPVKAVAKPQAAKAVASTPVAKKTAPVVVATSAKKAPATPAKVSGKPATAKPATSAKGKVLANTATESPKVSASTKAKAGDESAPAETPAVDPFAETVPTTVESSKSASNSGLTDANVNVSDAGLVEIHVNDANLGEVLKMLSIQLERNIMASKDVRGTVTANLYDVTVKEALDAILRANDCGYREKGNVLFVYTNKELEAIDKADRKQVTETFRVYYTPAANAVNMIKPVLSPEAQVSFTTPAVVGIDSGASGGSGGSGGGGSKDIGGNSHATEDTIVVTDFPDRLEQVRKVLKEVDRRPQQVLVEAVILRATLKEDNELGIDFSVLGGVDFSNLTSAIGGGAPTGTTGELADKGFGTIQAGGSGLKMGLVTNNVSVFVNALEGITDTAVVANPKVLVLNKQPGSVHVGARLGYRTAVSTETLTADDVKFLEIGTRLNFRPYIANDGYIRMEISPKDSSGNVTTDGLPNEFVTEVTSNIMVRDGRTIVIGGLFRESSDSTRSQVPGLGNLPVAGNLFKKQKDSTIREEVIILLTPHIIKDEDAYERLSAEEAKQVERMRVGTRQGMMPWGRERLADSAYQKAVEELAKPNPDRKKALWHLDCATNLNPKFVEAIALKTQLTGEEVTASDGSSIRTFVKRNVMESRRVMDVSATTQPTALIEEKAPAAVIAPVVVAPVAKAETPATQPVAAVEESTEVAVTEPESATTQPTAEAEMPAEEVVEETADAATTDEVTTEPAGTETPDVEVVAVEESATTAPTVATADTEESSVEVVDDKAADEVTDVLVDIGVEDAATGE